MQVARRRWSAVLSAGTALAPKDVCIRAWLSQSGRAAHGRLGAGSVETPAFRAPNRRQPFATHM